MIYWYEAIARHCGPRPGRTRSEFLAFCAERGVHPRHAVAMQYGPGLLARDLRPFTDDFVQMLDDMMARVG